MGWSGVGGLLVYLMNIYRVGYVILSRVYEGKVILVQVAGAVQNFLPHSRSVALFLCWRSLSMELMDWNY